MNAEFFSAIEDIEKEKGIPRQYMYDKIHQAMLAAFRKDNPEAADNVVIEMSEEKRKIDMYILKDVVEEVENPAIQVSVEEAHAFNKRARVGGQIKVPVETKKFGRIAAQSAKQVIIQGIREAERGMIFDRFSSREHEIMTGSVLRIDPNTGDLTVRIGQGNDRTDAWLASGEQVRGETYIEGDLIRVYVVEVRRSSRGPQVIVSRTHPGLVKRLFELNVPEIASGEVEIKSVAREAGSRTKLAVHAVDPNLDPVGTCVGPKGSRVAAVVNELHGEKMDIVVWNEDPAQFVAAALAPADVISVTPLSDEKSFRVLVPDDQLSLAIGKEGQNARLAARLTGHKIDIKPASAAEAPEA